MKTRMWVVEADHYGMTDNQKDMKIRRFHYE